MTRTRDRRHQERKQIERQARFQVLREIQPYTSNPAAQAIVDAMVEEPPAGLIADDTIGLAWGGPTVTEKAALIRERLRAFERRERGELLVKRAVAEMLADREKHT